ncbi:MAG: Alkaline phosphatase precursor [Planctomycetota bacterium]
MRTDHFPSLTNSTRRGFLSVSAGLLASLALPRPGRGEGPRPRFSADPFALGVASGDPAADGMVLWTRLATRPLDPDGGLAPEPVSVNWELAHDEGFSRIVASGATVALPQLAHCVHVELTGLEPDRWYWYRFHSGDATSPKGRTRTLPAAGTLPARARFAFASCQNYETGHYAAYRHMAEADHDLVFHLGDYIYEMKSKAKGAVRPHGMPEIHSLADYRIRHSLYRSDPLLQAAHAACPWMVTWDDHEVDNNYCDAISEETDVDPAAFLDRRANAYQAYYEMMPLRHACLPRGADMRLHRDAAFGDLASFFVLDTRQHRSDQPHGGHWNAITDECLAAEATMLGREQAGWLAGRLIESAGRWNVLAQQVMLGMVDRTAGDDRRYAMDQWPGYLAERRRLLEFMHDRRVPNPVILTGDIHSNWVNDLRADDRDPSLPVLATEFVGTGISSPPNGLTDPGELATLAAENPSLVWHGGGNGYASCTVEPARLETTYFTVDDIARGDSPVSIAARFAVESGRPGATQL